MLVIGRIAKIQVLQKPLVLWNDPLQIFIPATSQATAILVPVRTILVPVTTILVPLGTILAHFRVIFIWLHYFETLYFGIHQGNKMRCMRWKHCTTEISSLSADLFRKFQFREAPPRVYQNASNSKFQGGGLPKLAIIPIN